MYINQPFKYIVIVLHGYACNTKKYESIKAVIEKCYPEPIVVIRKLGMTTFSVADPDNIVVYAMGLIDSEWKKYEQYGDLRRVVIIGHSTGAVLARKLYVAACGENDDAPLEKPYALNSGLREWAAHVDRIILFAGMNRGWSINPHLYTKTAFLIRIGVVIGNILRWLQYKPLAFKTMKGGSFITQLRIQWLSMQRHAQKKNVGSAMTIQLLGTIDDIVSPEDNIDLVTGNQFIYLEMPQSNHLSVLKMDEGDKGAIRSAIFEKALTAAKSELYNMQILPSDQSDIKIDNDVTDVVFVIHGIRDKGYWTHKVARRVKAIGDTEIANGKRKFATETSSYGYFAMLPFLLPSVRRQKVEWLMDQYTENLALYPNASFSFMGHSNGTYLLAKALKEYPACTFKHVVFAGSVVHTKFDWKEMIRQGRISKFYNFVASSDWVVAMFPKTFQMMRIQDLGSGGFDGFTSMPEKPYQLKFIKGAHGAATKEEYWNEIAHFIVYGKPSENVEELSTARRSTFMKFLGAAAPIPFILIVDGLLWGAWAIIYCISDINLKLLILFIYLFSIYKIVTKI